MSDQSKLRVLLVDDEADLLRGLRRVLRPLRATWDVHTAVGPHAALEKIEEQEFDVVVSDMRMPEVDGAELLRRVRERRPETLRFILTGQSNSEALIRAAPIAHQVLWKPCDVRLLRAAIDRAMRLRDALSSPDVATQVAELSALPALPETYRRLADRLERPAVSSREVAEVLETDPSLAAKTLQLANSAAYGRRGIDSVRGAVDLLGVDTIRAVALAHGLATTLVVREGEHAQLRSIWDRSERVAASAREIAGLFALPSNQRDAAFSAGLLHDVGGAVALQCGPFPRDRHALVGAYLLSLWGLPHEVVGAVAWHPDPGGAPVGERAVLLCVHAAHNVVAARNGDPDTQLDTACLQAAWGEGAVAQVRALAHTDARTEASA